MHVKMITYYFPITFFHETSLWLLHNKDLMNKKYYIHIVPVYTYYIVFNSEKKNKDSFTFFFVHTCSHVHVYMITCTVYVA